MTTATVVHVEGFDDRHFLAGLIEHHGWKAARSPSDWERVKSLQLDSQTPNASYGYLSSGRDRSLLVNPGHSGRGNDRAVFERIEFALSEPERARTLVACVDSDASWEDPQPLNGRISRIRELDPNGRVELAVWHWKPTMDRPGIPRSQTLERLVLGVLSEVETSKGYGPIVERFLLDPPGGSPPTGKHFAWATMAKWYGEHGCGDFYQALWRERAFAEAMLRTMDEHRILLELRAALSG